MDLGGRKSFPNDEQLYPGLLRRHADDINGAFIKCGGVYDVYTELEPMYRREEKEWRGFYSNGRVSFARRNPLHTVSALEADGDELLGAVADGGYDSLLPTLFKWIDVSVAADYAGSVVRDMESADDVFDFCEAVMTLAEAERQRAFRALSEEEVDFIREKAPLLLSRLSEHMYLSVPQFEDRRTRSEYFSVYEEVFAAEKKTAMTPGAKDAKDELERARDAVDEFMSLHEEEIETDNQRYAEMVQLIRLTRKTDYTALAKMTSIMSVFLRQDVRDLIKVAIENEALEKAATRSTAFGKMVIAGRSDDLHANDCAVIIDLGGDDTYRALPAGGRVHESPPLRLIIDYDGKDTYGRDDPESQPFSFGAGLMGVGMLIDEAGEDAYWGNQGEQGFAFLGAGVVMDCAGDDDYVAREWGQGSGIFGVGLLLDKGGNDTYLGGLHCQASAATKGAGVLLDICGDDQYLSGGHYPSTFEAEGHYDGRSQGFAMGLRSLSADRSESFHGGVAMLLDARGNDKYKGSEFSQGGGYFFGIGCLLDKGGSDAYESVRFGTGFGVHSGIGAVVDYDGDDTYRASRANSLGAGWDRGQGYLEDKAGSDNYSCGALGLGCGSHNGIGVFADHDGNDSYESKGMTHGFGGKNTYHGGHSLGVFLDDGGLSDAYTITIQPRPGIGNDKILTESDCGVFVDR